MYSGVFHREERVAASVFLDPVLPSLDLTSSGEGLAGSIFEGGVRDDDVNRRSSVSREYSLPA